MNRGQLKTRVSRIIGIALGTSDDAVDETALLEELANEAVLDVLSRTRVHVRRATATLLPGATDFDIDDSILRIWDIHRNGANGSETLLAKQAREEMTDSGVAFPGLSRMTLGLQSGTNETITFLYTPEPTPMTADANDPAVQAYGRIPAEHHRALLNYMCWHSADKAGDRETSRGERYRILYEGQDGMGLGGSDLGRVKAHVNRRGGIALVKRAPAALVSDTDSSYWRG